MHAHAHITNRQRRTHTYTHVYVGTIHTYVHTHKHTYRQTTDRGMYYTHRHTHRQTHPISNKILTSAGMLATDEMELCCEGVKDGAAGAHQSPISPHVYPSLRHSLAADEVMKLMMAVLLDWALC